MKSETTVSVSPIHMTTMLFHLVGMSPLVPHAMSAKAAGQLLFPPPKKNAVEKATTMKHEPIEEFRAAAYKFRDHDDQPTRLYMPGEAFHAAIASVAIDMPGAKKSQVGRLTRVTQEKIPVWGIPDIWSTIVRSSDMKRTPDVRILPHLARWATMVEIKFISALIKEASLANLFNAAGMIIGIGDGRPEKGKKGKGTWRLCDQDDPEFLEIVRLGGREAQDAALANPQFADIETEQLLSWFDAERERRIARPPTAIRKRRNGAPEPFLHVT